MQILEHRSPAINPSDAWLCYHCTAMPKQRSTFPEEQGNLVPDLHIHLEMIKMILLLTCSHVVSQGKNP